MAETLDPQSQRPAPSPDPAWQQAWQQLNPKGTPAQMTEDYFAAQRGQVKPVDLSAASSTDTRSIWARGRDAVTHGVAAMVDAGSTPLREVLSGNPNPVSILDKMKERAEAAKAGSPSIGQSVAPYIVPQTPAAALTLAAGGPATRALGPVKAALGMAGAGAAANAVTGDSPVGGAVTGAAGTAIPAAVTGATSKAIELGRRFMGKAGERAAITEPWAQRFLDGMKEDVPHLHDAVRNMPGSAPARAAAIHDDAVFDAALRPQMDRAENLIAQSVPQVPNPFPSAAAGPTLTSQQQVALSRMPPAMQAQVRAQMARVSGVAPQADDTMISTTEAFKRWHDAKAAADEAYKADVPGASKHLRDIEAAWEQAILKAAPPEMGHLWTAARAEFGRGMRYRELGQSALAGADPTAAGTPFDPSAVVAKTFGDPSKYSPSVVPGFHKNFWGSAEQGAQPTVAKPDIYGRAFLGYAKANIPMPGYATLPGQTPKPGLSPTAEAHLGGATRAGIVSLSGQK
jgi:hypothetical protein